MNEQEAVDKYNDPKSGLWGKTKMMRKYRKILNNMYALQRHRETNARMIRKHYKHITSPEPFFSVQVDLADFPKLKKDNYGYRYLMVVIDVFSRYIWVQPLYDRAKLHDKLALIIRKMRAKFHDSPYNMTGDNEFATTYMQAVAAKYNFKWYFSDAGEKYRTGMVERVIRTIRNLIKRYMSQHSTKTYIDVLPDLVYNYNHTYHRIIKTTPHDAITKRKNYIENPQNEIPPLEKGQKVRIQEVRKRPFTKGSVPYYSKDVFKIVGRDKNRYIVENNETNERVVKKYGRSQLYKIDTVIPPLPGAKKSGSRNKPKRERKKIRPFKPVEIQRMDKIDSKIEKLKKQNKKVRGVKAKIQKLKEQKNKQMPSVRLPDPPIPINEDDEKADMADIGINRDNLRRAQMNKIKAQLKPSNARPVQPLRRSGRVRKKPDRYVPADFRKVPKPKKYKPAPIPKHRSGPKIPMPPKPPPLRRMALNNIRNNLRRSRRIRKKPKRWGYEENVYKRRK